MKILFLASNGLDDRRLALDREIRSISERVRATPQSKQIQIVQEWAVCVEDVQEHLLRHRPDIVHVSAHGSSNGAPEFAKRTERGASGTAGYRDFGPAGAPQEGGALETTFQVLAGRVRCLVLNACFSGRLAERLARHVDCVIGVSDAIGDDAAILYSSHFYQALGFGESVRTAHDLACAQLRLARPGVAQSVPDLYHRAAVNPGGLRLVCPEAEPKVSVQTPSPSSTAVWVSALAVAVVLCAVLSVAAKLAPAGASAHRATGVSAKKPEASVNVPGNNNIVVHDSSQVTVNQSNNHAAPRHSTPQ